LAAVAQSPTLPGEIVAGVELHLPAGADPSGFPELLAVQRGDRLSIRAVRRTVERLYATGRLADVVVRTLRRPEGITVVFELTPKRYIAALRVQDNRLLSKRALLTAAKLAEGTEYYPERLQEATQAITRAYRRRGYEHARVDVQAREIPQGVEVLLVISEGDPTQILGISFAGTPGLPLPQLVEVIGMDIGSVLDLERLGLGLEKLRTVYRKERFYRARIDEPSVFSSPQGALLAIPVDSGPRYAIHFHGNRSFRDQVLVAILHYDGTEILDRDLIGRLARRLENFYRYRGFKDVRVQPRETFNPNHLKAVLAFDIEEGLPLALTDVEFEGNHELTAKELQKILVDTIGFKSPEPLGDIHPNDDPLELEGRTATSQRASEPDPDPSTVFVEDAYREAAETMTQTYRDRGFLDARVSLAKLDQDKSGRSSVLFQVSEGTKTILGGVSYTGVPDGFDLKPVETIRTGDPMSASAVERERAALVRALGRKGYLFARVETKADISPNRQSAHVTFQVYSGPQVRVGQIILQGLNRTHPEVVRANLQIRSGTVLDPEDLFESQRNLVILGIFRQVAVRLIDPETPEPVKDIVVDVKEAPRLDGNIFGGFSLIDGPQFGGDILYPNLTGRAVNLSARGKINYAGLSTLALTQSDLHGINGVGGRGNITLQEPRIYAFLPLKLGARLDLVGEKVFRPSYRFTRFAALPGLDWTAYSWLTFSLQYEIEHDRVRATPDVLQLLPTLGLVDQERLRFPVGNFTLQSIRPGVALDFRDNVANPHRGLLIAGTSEVTHDIESTLTDAAGRALSSFPIFTLKLSGNLTFYVPVAPRVTLAFSGRTGRIFHLNDNPKTIPPKSFYLGGTTSLRGFREDGVLPVEQRESLHQELADCRALVITAGCTPGARVLLDGNQVPSEGGDVFILGKSELRFPAFGAFDIGLFFEAGNLWQSIARYNAFDLRYSAGGGLRYATPIGPLALDLAFNLVPDTALNESVFQLHFSIGVF
jgi:outer membrane protein assembly factor BamA